MYEIETEDLYQDIWSMREHFDLSDMPVTSGFQDKTNEKVVGKMKDETLGDPIVEFVGLRPKMYSFKTVNDQAEYQEKHRAKEISRAAAARLRHQEYKDQLAQPEENYLVNRRIGAKLHKLYSIEVCCFEISFEVFLSTRLKQSIMILLIFYFCK
jgi:hypothetical protein